MKKSRFFIGNIVKKSYKTFREPVVFMLGDAKKDSIEEIVVKENALLFKTRYGFVDVENLINDFDLIAEYLSKKYMDIEYLEYLKSFTKTTEVLYVDKKSVTSYFPKEEKNQRTSIGKVRRLAFNDPRVNIQEKK